MAEPSEAGGGLRDYMTDFFEITKRLEDGREFTTQALGFWQKLAKLQQNFAQGVLDLCHGKQATMEKLLLRSKIKTDGSKEHVRELREAWSCLVDEVEEMGQKYAEMSKHIEKQIVKPIDGFTKRKLTKQSATALNGRRSLMNLQFSYKSLRAGRKRLQKVKEDESPKSDDLEEDVEEGEVKLEPDSTEITENAQKLKDEHHRVFAVILPGIIEEMNVVEQERVELLYSCMNQFARTASESVPFDKTVHSLQTALENPQKVDLSVDCTVPDHQYLLFGEYKDSVESQDDPKFSWRGIFKKSDGNKENEGQSSGKFSFNWRGWFRKKKPKGEEDDDDDDDDKEEDNEEDDEDEKED